MQDNQEGVHYGMDFARNRLSVEERVSMNNLERANMVPFNLFGLFCFQQNKMNGTNARNT